MIAADIIFGIKAKELLAREKGEWRKKIFKVSIYDFRIGYNGSIHRQKGGERFVVYL